MYLCINMCIYIYIYIYIYTTCEKEKVCKDSPPTRGHDCSKRAFVREKLLMIAITIAINNSC